ncbi:MAG TPA: hypothetical protein VMV46_17125 [Thermoanaerobaculia bacterium]|nr:hypothetical protein [Thermoanaerobaculia bacterium]
MIDLTANDLDEWVTRLRHQQGDTFVRLTEEGEPREPWVFELGEDGRARRILCHSTYLKRID